MNKFAVFLAVSYLLLNSQIYCKNIEAVQKKSNHITLESPLVGILDKLMPASAYGLMLQVRRETRKRLYGVKNENGQMVGRYEYGGKIYTILELVQIERQHQIDYLEKKNHLIESKLSYSEDEFQKELIKIEKEYDKICVELGELLAFAKEDFLSVSACYAESARGTKKEILGIMKESCEKRGSEGCVLLKWGEEDETNEGISLRNEVVTFESYSKFCVDLCNFLEDLARNCPATKKKFYDLVMKRQKANAK